MVKIANRINRFLEQSMPWLAPLGVTLGVIFPAVFLEIRPYIPWLFGAMTLAGALRLRVGELGRAVSSPIPILLFFITARVFMPLIAFSLGSLIFRNDPDIVAGYVLLYSVPTAITSFIWVTIFKGDLALILAIILLDSLLAPLLVPVTLQLLLGSGITIDTTGLAVSMVYLILIPTILGVSLNEFSKGKIPALVSPWLNPFSKATMPFVIAANAAAVAHQIRPDNPLMWVIIIVCFTMIIIGFACGKLIGLAAKIDKEKQSALFFASGLRNTAAALVLGTEFFPASAALPAVFGIMLQQTTAAIAGRIFLGKIRKDVEN